MAKIGSQSDITIPVHIVDSSAANQKYVDFLPAASCIVSVIIAEQESDGEHSDMLPFTVDGCAGSVLMNRYNIKFAFNCMIIWAYGAMVAYPR